MLRDLCGKCTNSQNHLSKISKHLNIIKTYINTDEVTKFIFVNRCWSYY